VTSLLVGREFTIPYNTWREVVRRCGLSEEATEAVLANYITDADKAVIEMITTKVLDEVLTEGEDVNEYFTEHKPIADVNADKSVQGWDDPTYTKANADFHVYYWTDAEKESTKTEIEIDQSKLNASRGRIVLKSDLPSDAVQVTCDYSYYPNEIDFDLLCYCAALYTGYQYCLSEYSLFPGKMVIGPLKLDFSGRAGTKYERGMGGLPHERLLREFNSNLMLLIKKPFRKVKGKPMEKIVTKLPEDIYTVEI